MILLGLKPFSKDRPIMTKEIPPISDTSRRQFMKFAAGGMLSIAGLPTLVRAKPPAGEGMTLGFGLYGMKGVPVEKAIRLLADIGFDSVQLCLIPGRECAPSRLSAKRRREIRRMLNESGLALPNLQEHVPLGGDDKTQQAVLKRLRQAAELAHELVPNRPPIVETTTGGKGKKWEVEKNRFRDNLGRWADLAKSTQTVIGIKPHRTFACSRPEEAIWLVEQSGSPWIKLVYDYSHFDSRDIPLQKSLAMMLPYTEQIVVKDTEVHNGKVKFALPGTSGRIDYVALLRQAFAGGYRGDVCCEVSSAVHGVPGYDPEAAAKTCYKNMALAFREAGISRRRKGH